MQKNAQIFLVSLFLISNFMSWGCAVSKPGNTLPIRSIKEFQTDNKLAVDYEIKWLSQTGENHTAALELDKAIARTFIESKLFNRFTEGSGKEQYHLKITLKNHGDLDAARASGTVSGLFFGIIPASARDNYTLDVAVFEDEKLLQTFVYREYMDTSIGWIFLIAPNESRPILVFRNMLDNMLRNFLYDLIRSNLAANQVVD